ncbi:tripartite motif-containing protein 14 [Callorhinchus milii]|uniref:E3 ubiquitin-protein ligase TRIM39-like n=2 Tax=Callorhinchus milii TaxID=7868 RepID=A0A4W3GWP9_CALMI|nr:tripartite motif-containing protein 14 [Callorhinchus milii]
MRQNLESFPLSLQDMEEIIRRTRQSVGEKYRVVWKLLEEDMRRTEGLIEAERVRMERLLRGQQVDSVAYSDSITAIFNGVERLGNSTETRDIRRLQEIVSWRTRLEMFEDLEQNIGKQCWLESGRLASLERSVDELRRSVSRILPRMWQYSRNLSFDVETCHPCLCVLSDQCSVHYIPTPLNLPNKNQRFEVSYNVLARESFSSGKHYWEVRVSRTGSWSVGVAYASMARKGKGKETVLGKNKHSWVLRRLDREYHALHASDSISLDLNHKDHGFERLGVFLHCEEGRLSFYNVDRASHIHSFKAHFRAPLFPAFSPASSRHVRNHEPIILCHLSLERESEDCAIGEE